MANFTWLCRSCGATTLLSDAGGNLSCDCGGEPLFWVDEGKYADHRWHTLKADGSID